MEAGTGTMQTAGKPDAEATNSGLMGKMGSWAVSSFANKLYGKGEGKAGTAASEKQAGATKQTEQPQQRMGDIDRSKFQTGAVCGS